MTLERVCVQKDTSSSLESRVERGVVRENVKAAEPVVDQSSPELLSNGFEVY